jgi:hypothetical protein
MPLKFWDEAFCVVVYLINHTPSKVIQIETLIERLFHVKHDYQYLRVFGYASWPNLRPFNDHKLQFWSKQCVFLGYSHQHKGFKCLDVIVGCIYISWDVVFDENVTPFASLHANVGARLRAEVSLLPSHVVDPPHTDHDGACTIDKANVDADSSNPSTRGIFVEVGLEKSGETSVQYEEDHLGSCVVAGLQQSVLTSTPRSPLSSVLPRLISNEGVLSAPGSVPRSVTSGSSSGVVRESDDHVS